MSLRNRLFSPKTGARHLTPAPRRIPPLQQKRQLSRNVSAFFTPYDDCTTKIVNEIKKAEKTIHVQAYSFTSSPIAKAITEAKERGVDVKVILDKSQFNDKQYSSSTYLMNNDIPTWSDDKVRIAHNKVMIIDKATVITGSFNFTKAAQNKNAENIVIIEDKEIARQYLDNWKKRHSVSRRMSLSEDRQ